MVVLLRSADGEVFEVEEGVAFQSRLIKDMMEDLAGCGDNSTLQVQVPLPSVTARILAQVLEYCKAHLREESTSAAAASTSTSSRESTPTEHLRKFDEEFVRVDNSVLFELVVAANYLNIPSLLEVTCQAVADLIKDKTPEQIRKILHIENDFTPEEEEEVRRENEWAFQ